MISKKLKYMVMALSTAVLLSAAGCSSISIKNLSKFKKAPLKQANFMPTKSELAGSNSVVFAGIGVDKLVKNSRAAKLINESGVSGKIGSQLESYLSKISVELIKRSDNGKLSKEYEMLAFSDNDQEENTALTGDQFKEANFIILGELSSADASAEFSPSYITTHQKRKVRISPHCIYRAEVSGVLRIYKLPEVQKVKSIKLKYSTSDSNPIGYAGRCRVTNNIYSLVTRAGSEAIDQVKTEIQNFFAPKGYISGKRVYDGKTIFKINIGSNNGLKYKDKLDILAKYIDKDGLSGKESVDYKQVAKAVVSNQVSKHSAWIIVDKKSTEKKVRLGHLIKTKYSKSIWSRFKGIGQ